MTVGSYFWSSFRSLLFQPTTITLHEQHWIIIELYLISSLNRNFTSTLCHDILFVPMLSANIVSTPLTLFKAVIVSETFQLS